MNVDLLNAITERDVAHQEVADLQAKLDRVAFLTLALAVEMLEAQP